MWVRMENMRILTNCSQFEKDEFRPMKRFFRLILILTTLTQIMIGCSGTEFNSEEWKNWEESEADLFMRWDMTDDLINDYDLKGMSTEQVIELLGKPENRTEKEFRYFLGHTRQGINTGSLILTIEKDTITDYKVFEG